MASGSLSLLTLLSRVSLKQQGLRALSTSNVRAAAKAAAKEEPAEDAKPKERFQFSRDGRLVLTPQLVFKRKAAVKLAIEPIKGKELLRFVPAGLQYCVIETHRTSNMTRAGKKPSYSSLVVVGNKSGAAGFSFGRGHDPRNSINKAIMRASRNMIPIKLMDGHTIHAKTIGKWRNTRVFARPGREGKGRVCHKYIDRICQLAGIQNLSADVLGRKNPLSIVHAFFQVLGSQKSIEEIAAEQGKSVVEYRQLDAPPTIGFRAPATGEAVAKRKAELATLDWIKTFPRTPNFPNFFLARQVLQGATPSADVEDIRAWFKTAPAVVSLSNTAFRGCPPPAGSQNLQFISS